MIENFFEESYQNLLCNSEALDYLKERGVSEEQIEKYKFGFVNKSQKIPEDRGFREKFNNGKRFWNRIIFPLYTPPGKIVSIGSRPFKGKGSYLYYDFIKTTDPKFFGIQNLENIFKSEVCYLTEGIFDHLVLEKYQSNALCSLTANVSIKQMRYLLRFINNLVVVFDLDKAGNEKYEEITRNYGNKISISRLSKFNLYGSNIKDLNELYTKLGESKFRKFMEEQNNLLII